MTYPYGMKGAPVVGNGLGGLPRRAVAAGAAAAAVAAEPSYSISAENASPWAVIYKQQQFGAPTATNISGLSQNPRSVDISPDGKFVAIGLATTPFIAVYSVNNGVFTRLADPDLLPSAAVWEVRFFANNRFVVGPSVGAVLSYQITNNLVTRVEQIDGLISSQSKQTIEFSDDFRTFGVVVSTSPYIRCYTQQNGSFTALDPVDVTPSSVVRCVEFSSDGTYMAIGLNSAPFLAIYKRVGNRFEKLTDPATMPTSASLAIAFDPNGTGFFEDNVNQGTTFYSRSGDVFTRGSALSGARPNNVYGLIYTKDGKFLSRVGSGGGAPTSMMWSVSGTTYTEITSPFSANTALTYWGIAMYARP